MRDLKENYRVQKHVPSGNFDKNTFIVWTNDASSNALAEYPSALYLTGAS